MKSLLCSIVLLLASLTGLGKAQTQIGQFQPQFLETFESNPGASPGFFGLPPLFGGPPSAIFSPTTADGILMKSQNQQMLPANRGLTCLFGRATDVRITFDDPMRKFGGFFSRTNVAGAPTAVQFDFYRFGLLVWSFTAPLPPTAGPGTSNYVGLFFDLGFAGFDRVDILGVGGVFPAHLGFVGMDDLITSQI
ncbi:MAG TPA: hypothetical protein VF384_07560 [Planctomycetota bacterium]